MNCFVNVQMRSFSSRWHRAPSDGTQTAALMPKFKSRQRNVMWPTPQQGMHKIDQFHGLATAPGCHRLKNYTAQYLKKTIRINLQNQWTLV